MGAVCGIVRFDGSSISSELSSVMMDKLKTYKHDESNTWSDGQAFLGNIVKYNTHESTLEKLPFEDISNNLVFAVDAIIDNRIELLKQFDIPKEKWIQITDSKLISFAYLKWGEECPKYLIGDFVFVVWNKKKKELFCARDQVGKRTLYYCFSSNIFAFSTVIKPLLHIAKDNSTLNELWIAEFLSLEESIQEIECDNTVYKNIRQVLPAHSIKLNANEIVSKRYWNPMDTPKLYLKSNTEYEEAFRKVFLEAVHCRLRSAGCVGVLLSGGLDSGSVACIAAKKLQEESKRLKGFSSVPFSKYIDYLPEYLIADEREAIEAIACVYNNIDLNYCESGGINSVNSIEALLDILEQPYKIVENFFWLNELTEKAAEKDCTILLNGQFGNSTVSFGDMKTYLYTKYKQHRWIAFIKAVYEYNNIHNYKFKDSLRYFIKSVVSDKTIIRYMKLRKRPIESENEIFTAVNPEFARKCNVDGRLKHLELGKYYKTHQDINEVQSFLAKPMFYSQVGAVETKLSLTHGITVRDPTRDKRIIEFCASVPLEQFVYKGEERSLIRRSMKGILPDEIRLNYKNRGRQSADWIQRLQADWAKTETTMQFAFHIKSLEQFVDTEKALKILEEIGHFPKDEDALKIRMLVVLLIFENFISSVKAE